MSQKPREIKLKNIFDSVVFNVPIKGKLFWSGVIDSEQVDEFLVDDSKMRNDLKFCIEKLEEEIKAIRTKTSNNMMDNSLNISIYSDKIFQIVAKSGTVNLELYLVYIINKFELIKKKNPDEYRKINTKCKNEIYENKRNVFGNNEVVAYPVFWPEKNEYGFDTVLLEEQKGKVNKKENGPQLINFLNAVYGRKLADDEQLTCLDEVNELINISDLLESIISPDLRRLFWDSVTKNFLLNDGMKPQEINSLKLAEFEELSREMYLLENVNLYCRAASDTLLSHIEYFSIDRVALAYLQRRIEEYNISAQLSYDFKEISDESKQLEAMIKRVVNSRVIGKKTSINVRNDDGDNNVTFKIITDIQKKFIDGVYLTPDIIRVIKGMLLEKKSTLEECSKEVIKALQLSNFYLEIVSLVDFKNLKRLHDVEIIDKSFIDRLVRNCSLENYKKLQENDKKLQENDKELQENDKETMDYFRKIEFPSKMELIKYLFSESIINYDDLYKYYILNEITLDELDEIKETLDFQKQEKFDEQLREKIDINSMMKYYKDYAEKYEELIQLELEIGAKKDSQNDGKKERIEQLKLELEYIRKQKEKILLTYQKYNDGLSEEDKRKNGNEIVESFYFNMEIKDDKIFQSAFISMYEDGLISPENILNLDSEFIIPMLDKLSFEDIDKIKANMSLDDLISMIEKTFEDPEITDNRKFIIIMNMLGDEDEEIVEYKEMYLSMLGMDGKEKKAISTGKKRKIGNGKVHESKAYVYPDTVKWKFFRALDPTMRVTRYDNGYVEFYSERFGKYIIDKYYDGNKLAYGTATCILDKDKYKQNELDLVTHTLKGTILESSVLRRITPKADRVAHRTQSGDRTWMDDILQYLDVDFERGFDTRYTPEELEKLHAVVDTYKHVWIELEK